ncbi:hypothetical protein CIB84_005195 [Bambusicola thoracicus]|uniref:Uncharacterized protein n=1 Tax=Bambusicola thoracicus TaxID=9083 RepID=A0A2P4T3X1_BAMTH|nr:hypothetical protein CIB84_005195 [Bambusicola thoracicus]
MTNMVSLVNVKYSLMRI